MWQKWGRKSSFFIFSFPKSNLTEFLTRFYILMSYVFLSNTKETFLRHFCPTASRLINICVSSGMYRFWRFEYCTVILEKIILLEQIIRYSTYFSFKKKVFRKVRPQTNWSVKSASKAQTRFRNQIKTHPRMHYKKVEGFLWHMYSQIFTGASTNT